MFEFKSVTRIILITIFVCILSQLFDCSPTTNIGTVSSQDSIALTTPNEDYDIPNIDYNCAETIGYYGFSTPSYDQNGLRNGPMEEKSSSYKLDDGNDNVTQTNHNQEAQVKSLDLKSSNYHKSDDYNSNQNESIPVTVIGWDQNISTLTSDEDMEQNKSSHNSDDNSEQKNSILKFNHGNDNVNQINFIQKAQTIPISEPTANDSVEDGHFKYDIYDYNYIMYERGFINYFMINKASDSRRENVETIPSVNNDKNDIANEFLHWIDKEKDKKGENLSEYLNNITKSDPEIITRQKPKFTQSKNLSENDWKQESFTISESDNSPTSPTWERNITIYNDDEVTTGIDYSLSETSNYDDEGYINTYFQGEGTNEPAFGIGAWFRLADRYDHSS